MSKERAMCIGNDHLYSLTRYAGAAHLSVPLANSARQTLSVSRPLWYLSAARNDRQILFGARPLICVVMYEPAAEYRVEKFVTFVTRAVLTRSFLIFYCVDAPCHQPIPSPLSYACL